MLTVKTLASGSSGNATLVSGGNTHILLDDGLPLRTLLAHLQASGIPLTRISAVFVTHEHRDHIHGLQYLPKRAPELKIIASGPTCQQIDYRIPFVSDRLEAMKPEEPMQIGDLKVESFLTPHDAAESMGYIVSGCGGRMVLCTDLGTVTPAIRRAVQGCDLLICEANHDVDMLRTGPYPYHLKRRILSNLGHLSNEEGAELAALSVRSGCKAVILAHLSAENNTPSRALAALENRLKEPDMGPEAREADLVVAPRKTAGPTFCIENGAVYREGGEILCGTYS